VASALALGGSPPPSRLTSPDVVLTAAPVIGSDTAGSAAATPLPKKRQRHHYPKNGSELPQRHGLLQR
jgi:hypothetical protein